MSSEHHAIPGPTSPPRPTPAPTGSGSTRTFFVDFHPGHEAHLPGGDPTTEIFS
jgi:hypothetical protein